MAMEAEYEVGDTAAVEAVEEIDADDATLMAEIEEAEGGAAPAAANEDALAFDANLVEFMDPADLDLLAAKLILDAERDKESTSKRDEQYAEGVRRTGLGKDAPGGPAFEGASEVVHPLIAEAAVDFGAMVMKELFPADGPVRIKMIADADEERMERAERKKKHLNYQITEQSPGFIEAHEQMSIQIGLGGSQYIILFWENGGPKAEFVPVDRVWLPYAAQSFRAARRRTLVWDLTASVVKERIRGGMYADVIDADIAPSTTPEESKAQEANDKVEGVESDGMNEDGIRRIYQMYVWMDFEGKDPLIPAEDDVAGGEIPYIIAIDKESTKIIAIYRNWEEQRAADFGEIEEVDWVVPWDFIPWKGPYAVGFPHLIGSISSALTGALRSLLNSAHIANFPGLARLKGGRNSGQTDRVNPTENIEIKAASGIDDIRKLAMPLPYPQPSSTLFSLLGFLTDIGKGVVSTSEEKISDAGNNMPVGTAMALMESGSKVTSSIMARMHRSMAMTLKIMHRMNRDYLDEERVFGEIGVDLIKREDYDGPSDIIPVSDPNIFSETQRIVVMQETARVAQEMFPDLNWNREAMARRFLAQLRTPNPDELLPPKPKAEPTAPVAENTAIALGELQQAFPDQMHEFHLQVHVGFLASPMFGMNKIFAAKIIPGMIEHIKDHLLMWYDAQIKATIVQQSGLPFEQIAKATEGSDKMAAVEAQVQPQTLQIMGQYSERVITPVIEAAMNLLEEMAPKDPTQAIEATAQATIMDVQSKDEERKGKLALEQQKAQQTAAERAEEREHKAELAEAALDQKDEALELKAEELAIRADQKDADAEVAVEKAAIEADRADDDRESRERIEGEKLDVAVELNDADNQTALEISRMRDRGGNPGNLKDGSSFSTRQPGDMV